MVIYTGCLGTQLRYQQAALCASSFRRWGNFAGMLIVFAEWTAQNDLLVASAQFKFELRPLRIDLSDPKSRHLVEDELRWNAKTVQYVPPNSLALALLSFDWFSKPEMSATSLPVRLFESSGKNQGSAHQITVYQLMELYGDVTKISPC